MTIRPDFESKLKTLPRSPGVYFHKSKKGEIIYVGKAAILKNRVRQYFQDSRNLDTKTMALVAEIYDTDWIEVESEIDALFLESEMVKRYMPRYNVLLRDDKSQTFVRIDMKNEWPYVSFTRNPADDGAEYIGPFYNSYALKKALRYLRKIFPYYIRERKATDSKLEMQIGLNPDTAQGSMVYKANLKKLISYVKGNRKAIANDIEQDMKKAARDHNFEKAAKLRNRLRAMKELQSRVMFSDKEFLDISKDQALQDIARLLGLKKLPVRIECFDVSHTSGTDVVSSMVVFTNGVSDRAEYRKFKMGERNDDYRNIYETVYRRLSVKNLHQWGKPDLIIIDGGKGQLEAAINAAKAKEIKVIIISIAKKNEEIIIHKSESGVAAEQIDRLLEDKTGAIVVKNEASYIVVNTHPSQQNAASHSKNLRGNIYSVSTFNDITKLFQRIRDESHRFAISYHSSLQRKRSLQSQVESIPGIGPATRKKLIKSFGSMSGVKKAKQQDIEKIIGKAKADRIIKWNATIR